MSTGGLIPSIYLAQVRCQWTQVRDRRDGRILLGQCSWCGARSRDEEPQCPVAGLKGMEERA